MEREGKNKVEREEEMVERKEDIGRKIHRG